MLLLFLNIIFIIYVIFKNEFVLSFVFFDVLIIVVEDIVKGSVIYDVNVIDVDFGVDGEIVYSIIDGNNDLRFMIDVVSGIIINDVVLDWEV